MRNDTALGVRFDVMSADWKNKLNGRGSKQVNLLKMRSRIGKRNQRMQLLNAYRGIHSRCLVALVHVSERRVWLR